MPLRLFVVETLYREVPPFVGFRWMGQLLRFCGVRLGEASMFLGIPTLVGRGDFCARLSIGDACGFNEGCFFELEDEIRIGHHVSVGHEVMFLTRSHEIGPARRRAGAGRSAPIVVGEGAWIGARATILPGVTIGAGAVIGAAATVDKDVPANTLVMGSTRVSLANWR
jgi:maltose O-acetyltransferase